MLLTRTDPDAQKHRGITYFIMDMRSPGVEVRPIRQANGRSEFGEIFLTDVRIPAENMIGAREQRLAGRAGDPGLGTWRDRVRRRRAATL